MSPWEAFGRVVEIAASAVAAGGILIAGRQLKLTQKQAETAFEDSLAREYRELAQRLPTAALLGEPLHPKAQENALDELYRYIDLSNEQVFLRMQGRITEPTWVNWCDGIRGNLAKPAFWAAWEEVSHRDADSFSELRRLIGSNYTEDPRSWQS